MAGRIPKATFLGLALLVLALRPAPAAVIADLSRHLVAITTRFAGAEVLLYGATDQSEIVPGVQDDVVVVVRGPQRDQTLHRKERLLGIWVNAASARFEEAPGYYAIAASRPLDQIAPERVLARNGIGLENLGIRPSRGRYSDNLAQEWGQAFVRAQQLNGLYPAEIATVTFLGNALFRTELRFPANVPTGAYQAQVFLFREGRVVSAQTTPLVIGKVGLEAEIFDFAHNQPALYGLVAILIALVAGWLAHVAFKKD